MTVHVSDVDIAAKSDAIAPTSPAIKRAAYLANLLQQRSPILAAGLNSGMITLLESLRDRAAGLIQELAIPSTRDEEWRFTNLSTLLEIQFQRVDSTPEVTLAQLEPFILPEVEHRLVCVNGHYVPGLSSIAVLSDGCFAGRLADLPSAQQNHLATYLAQQVGAEEVFTALNTASLTDVVVVWVGRGKVLESPIQLLNVVAAQNVVTLVQPRYLVVLETGSQGTVIEDYVSLTDNAVYLDNAVTEIGLEANARLTHARVQRDSPAAFHIGKTAVGQARDSFYTNTAVSLGASLTRHNLEIRQTGAQTETVLNGLQVLRETQLGDTHSTISFNHPHGNSQQLHKCIVDGRAHGVFNGKVIVPKPAQLTDASQLSRTLLLSPKARVDTKPQLEIVADNVKCAHGATVSQLDTEETFYLQSRGLGRDDACQLLVEAFAGEILQTLPIASLQRTLTQLIS